MKKKYVISIIAIILLLIGIIILFFWPPKFELKNGENITLKYGQKYKEPGYKVTRFGKDYTKKVKVKNKINKKVFIIHIQNRQEYTKMKILKRIMNILLMHYLQLRNLMI